MHVIVGTPIVLSGFESVCVCVLFHDVPMLGI